MSLKTETVRYATGGVSLIGHLAQDDAQTAPAPGVLVFPEWWGLNDYIRQRTEQVAQLGYVALGVDMYGDGKTVEHPEEAGALMNGVLNDPDALSARWHAAYELLKSHPSVNSSRLGAIGYCFGGALVLHLARLGLPLKAVVSFHGSLDPFHQPAPGGVPARVLVCHGAADAFIPQAAVEAFHQEMQGAQADYEFVAYEGALHGFTNPAASERGEKFGLPLAYDANADRQSWEAMRRWFDQSL
jgi:dienelactone hydrolase